MGRVSATNERAFEATARLEKDWHVEWAGWSEYPYWPLQRGLWFAVAPNKEDYIEAVSWASDTAEPWQLRIHQDEARFRLRMKIYLYTRAKAEEDLREDQDEAAGDDSRQSEPSP